MDVRLQNATIIVMNVILEDIKTDIMKEMNPMEMEIITIARDTSIARNVQQEQQVVEQRRVVEQHVEKEHMQNLEQPNAVIAQQEHTMIRRSKNHVQIAQQEHTTQIQSRLHHLHVKNATQDILQVQNQRQVVLVQNVLLVNTMMLQEEHAKIVQQENIVLEVEQLHVQPVLLDNINHQQEKHHV